MKKLILSLLLIGCSIIVNAQIKNLDKLPQAKRDSILLEIARQTVLKYAPDYYNDINNQPPLIKKIIMPTGDKDAGRVRFVVRFLYEKEFYDKYPNADCVSDLGDVSIWEDTGLASEIAFEGLGIRELDKPSKIRSANGKHLTIKKKRT